MSSTPVSAGNGGSRVVECRSGHAQGRLRSKAIEQLSRGLKCSITLNECILVVYNHFMYHFCISYVYTLESSVEATGCFRLWVSQSHQDVKTETGNDIQNTSEQQEEYIVINAIFHTRAELLFKEMQTVCLLILFKIASTKNVWRRTKKYIFLNVS